jgi:hypothetical protein
MSKFRYDDVLGSVQVLIMTPEFVDTGHIGQWTGHFMHLV